jgi:phenylacetate-coenzyme A ligase PaaK-like adenylate-forming protein
MTTATRADTGWGRFRADFQAELLARIPEHLERMSWSDERIEAAQRDGLRGLLAHAAAHSPFHRQRLAGTDIANIEPAGLASLPVMTKTDMMAAIDDVFTDRRLSLAAVEQALAVTGTEPVPVLGRYMALATGGSTGQRGVFVFDPAAKATFVLSIIRSLLARLHAAGGIPPGGLPMAMVGAGSAVHATGAAAAETIGPDTPLRILPVPVTLPWQQIVDRLNTLQAPGLMGYASALARLAAEKRAHRLDIAPTVIISTGETLLPEARAEITAAFGTPVINSFASTEGLMGSSAPGGDVLMFNSDMCIIELVDAGNRPVGPGVPSAKVLVTNLYNLAQPLIRYEFADSFVRVPSDSGPGHLLARVQGRADEVFHYQAGDLHPHVVRSVMVQSPEVTDYQVRQTRTGIEARIVAAGSAGPEALRRRLAEALARGGLSQPDVTVRVVGDLARNAGSGKLRRFIPLAQTARM